MKKPVNIGPKQRQTRAFFGIISLIPASFSAYYVLSTGSILFYLLTFVFLFNGTLLILEAIYGVCPVNALRDKQSMEGYFSIGQKSIKDAKRAKKLKDIAIKETLQSLLISILLVGLLYLFTK